MSNYLARETNCTTCGYEVFTHPYHKFPDGKVVCSSYCYNQYQEELKQQDFAKRLFEASGKTC